MALAPGLKLGRLARTYDSRIPHLSAIVGGKILPPPPPSINYAMGMSADLGMMLNDTLGDCTCAAFYHARQVWTFHSGAMQTASDAEVKLLYEKACGYNPNSGGEGPGGNEQHVLTYIYDTGAPIGATRVDEILGFVEVDPRMLDDVKRAIVNSGCAYIGFNVPENIMPQNAAPPQTWTVAPGNPAIIGGHAVILPGYDEAGPMVISWGAFYKMTWDFFNTYVDEVYQISDAAWIASATAQRNKLTLPGGMTAAELASQMEYL